jgi:hypothetical protein
MPPQVKVSLNELQRLTTFVSVIKNSQLIMDRKKIAACFVINTKRINTLCGQKVEFYMLNLMVNEETSGT